MSETIDTSSDARLTAALRAGGHRVTAQRLVLHRVLQELGTHATAEEVLQAAAPRLPGLSLPTVYASLDLLDRLGVARRIDGAGAAALYDPRPDGHQHFACRRCGRVLDVDGELDTAALSRAASGAGLRVDGIDVVLRGICAGCRQESP